MRVKPNPKKYKALKSKLHKAGVGYADVARLADVSYRMVQYVVDGQRNSPAVASAIERLTGIKAA